MNTKKKILICIDWYLPGYRAGGPIRSCANLISHLKDEFDFYVLTRNSDYLETKPYENVKENEWNVLPDGTNVYYFSDDKLNEVEKIIDSIDFDFIYLNGVFSKYFTIAPLKHIKREKRGKIVLATRGMLSPQALNLKKIKKKLFLTYAKISGLYSGITFHSTSSREIEQIKKVFGEGVKIKLAPNFGRRNLITSLEKTIKEKGKLLLVNIARIAPEKNQLFALQILKKSKANIQYDLYGSIYDKDYWKVCLAEINTLPANITVNYKGSLHENKIFETLPQYHFLFMPSVTENFGHIILESLSASVPVIISDNTPWKNLSEQKAGWNIQLEKSAEFINAIEKGALMDNEEYSIWTQSAFEYARKFNSNPEILRQNRNLFL